MSSSALLWRSLENNSKHTLFLLWLSLLFTWNFLPHLVNNPIPPPPSIHCFKYQSTPALQTLPPPPPPSPSSWFLAGIVTPAHPFIPQQKVIAIKNKNNPSIIYQTSHQASKEKTNLPQSSFLLLSTFMGYLHRNPYKKNMTLLYHVSHCYENWNGIHVTHHPQVSSSKDEVTKSLVLSPPNSPKYALWIRQENYTQIRAYLLQISFPAWNITVIKTNF